MPGHYNPDEFSQLHKTLSKSFVMQRKTLVRVLGLEGRVSELELQQAAEEQAKEGIDEILNDIHEAKEEEVGGTKTKTKPKAKAKPKVKPKAKKTKVKGKKINKPKIDADKFKRGTSQETLQERLERLQKNRQETAAGEEHKQTDEFTETTTGTDPKTGEPLSAAERKRRFKAAKFMNKTGLDPQDIKPETEGEGEDDGGSKVDDIIKFLNGEVKQKLDEINNSVVEIKDVLDTQSQLADDRDEDMRQALLAARKNRREGKLEGDDKKKGLQEKLLGQVTKPVEGFLGKLIKFVTMTFVGAIVNRIMGILKDPGQLLDPIKNFFNGLIGLVNIVSKGLWLITGAPVNLLITGINKGTQGLLGAFNKATGLLKIPAIEVPEIPLLPKPPDIPKIPLSKTAQEKNAGVAMAGGGLVPGDTGESGMDGVDGIAGAPGESGADGLEGLPGLGGGGGGTDAITMKAKSKSVGARTKDVGNLLARPFRTKADRLAADPRSQFASGDDQPQGFSGGGFVPYSNFTLGTGHNVIDTAPGNIMGYNKGGKVPGSGSGDIVPAMLTPGEFVMSKGAVDKIGVDNLMSMNKDGGGTNQPKMMKFSGGGVVPTIDPPSKKSKMIVVGGGGSKPPARVSSSGDSGSDAPKFSSTDNNNVTIAVIKSIYNIMS